MKASSVMVILFLIVEPCRAESNQARRDRRTSTSSGAAIATREASRAGMRGTRDGTSDALKEKALPAWVKSAAIAHAADRMRITVDSREIDKVLTLRRRSFPSQASWNVYVSSGNRTEATLRDEVRADLVRKRVLAALIHEPVVTDAEILRYYNEHRGTFSLATARVRGRMATIHVSPQANDAASHEARDRLAALRDVWLHEDCTQYCDCGDEQPPDGSDDEGGEDPTKPDVDKKPWCLELGKLVRSDLALAVEGLQQGDVTAVLKTSDGYAIYQVGERRQARMISYERAREDIRYKLTEEKRAIAEREAIRRIVCDAKPEIHTKPGGRELELWCPKAETKTR